MTHTTPSRPPRRLSGTALAFALLALVLAAGFVAAPAIAQQGFGAGAKMPGSMLVRGADLDLDGTVTADEWAQQLADLDADGDGFVSQDEVEAFRKAWRSDRPRRGPGARGDHFTRIHDTDGDGQVSTSELQTVFDDLDSNGDAAVSGDELPTFPMRHGRRGGPGRHLLGLADTDDDGDLTRDEWTAFLASADTDADGSIDGDELQTVIRSNRPVDREPPSLEIETLEELFDTIDADGNGVITDEERPAQRHRGPRGGGFGRMHGG